MNRIASSLAVVFPGQGAQEVGMLADLAADHAVVRETFAEASDVLGFDLWALAQEGPAAEQDKTANTQPLILTASVATFRVWRAHAAAPIGAMAGHSLGEYTALVCADALGFADAVRLVRARGEAMQRAVPEGEGGIAAILGLDDDVIAACCAQASELGVVSAANFNTPGQVAIAGANAALDRAIELCKAAGAKRAARLALSVPVHCALMQPAAAAMAPLIEAVAMQPPTVPVVQNVEATVAADVAAIRTALVQQIHRPVQWTRCVQTLASLGAERVIEAGPGKVLNGLIKRIDKGLRCESAGSTAGLAAAIALAAG